MSGPDKRIKNDALAKRTYGMSIEANFIEHVNRVASKRHIPVSGTTQQ